VPELFSGGSACPGVDNYTRMILLGDAQNRWRRTGLRGEPRVRGCDAGGPVSKLRPTTNHSFPGGTDGGRARPKGRDLLGARTTSVYMRPRTGPPQVDVILPPASMMSSSIRWVFNPNPIPRRPASSLPTKAGNVTNCECTRQTAFRRQSDLQLHAEIVKFYYMGGEPDPQERANRWRAASRSPQARAGQTAPSCRQGGGNGFAASTECWVVTRTPTRRPSAPSIAEKFKAPPADFIAPPNAGLSTVAPCFVESWARPPVNVDLRPTCCVARTRLWVVPGGLTRRGSKAGVRLRRQFLAVVRDQGSLGCGVLKNVLSRMATASLASRLHGRGRESPPARELAAGGLAALPPSPRPYAGPSTRVESADCKRGLQIVGFSEASYPEG